MIYIAVLFALGASFLNAVSSVIQRSVAGKPEPQELFRKAFIKGLLVNRLWLAAFGLDVVAFFCQAAALKTGSLVLVQPLLITGLIFIMLILYFRYGLPVGQREWAAVVMICVGLSGLLLSANPRSGSKPFDRLDWATVTLILLIFMSIGVFIVRRTRSAHWRAGLSGLAAGLSFALLAAFTKLATQQLHYGLVTTLTSWQVYALLVSGILAMIMTQNTYGAGPLVMSQPVMNITEPLVSIILGVMLFGDSISLSGSNLAVEIITGLLTGTGIWLMASSSRLYARPKRIAGGQLAHRQQPAEAIKH